MSKNHFGLRRRSLALTVAGLVGVAASGLAMAATPVLTQTVRGSRLARVTAPVATRTTHGHFAKLTSATRLSRGATLRGAVAGAKSLHVVLSLKLRNQTQLHAFIKAPHAPMSHARLAASYLPTRAQAQVVADYLTQAGFTHVKIAPDHLLVSADGRASVVQAAFQTTLAKVLTADGRQAYANTSAISIPAALTDSVQAVLGLQDVHRAHTLQRTVKRLTGPAAGLTGHYPIEFPTIYHADSLAPATSIPVAVWGWGNMAQSLTDLASFTATFGLAPVNATVVCTDYNGTTGAVSTTDPTCASSVTGGTGEWDLDSQDIVAMAGGVASLTFYSAPTPTNAHLLSTLSEIVNPTAGETKPMVVNASFGECELATDANQGGDGTAQAMDALFQAAAAQGMTFSVSTGDDGANECGFAATNRRAAASWPAASPWVVAVSGTTLRASATTLVRQTTWIHSGGSPSSFELAQPWQSSLTYGPYTGARGPDVAFDANPTTGSVIVVNGAFAQFGGTSLSAPLFAGAWARILQTNQNLGFAAPHLYALPASAWFDVTRGNNGGWSARRGWDFATGLGSLDVAAAAAALAN